MSIRFAPLGCPSCGSALTAEPSDILFLCRHCRAGAVLGETGLDLVESTALLPAPGRRAELWRPAWLLEAEVTVSDRVSADGHRSAPWQGRRTFVLPAFALSLSSLTTLARALSAAAAAGAVTEVPEEPVQGGVLSLDDALTLAQHLVVSEEISKPDMLASIAVEMSPVAHRLAALPFAREQQQLRCAVTGLRALIEG